MTYNKNVKKYIKQCKYLFASYGKSEKEYISKLIDNIDDGSHDMTYDEVVERLGTPKEVIISYYEQEDMDRLIEKANVYADPVMRIRTGILMLQALQPELMLCQ